MSRRGGVLIYLAGAALLVGAARPVETRLAAAGRRKDARGYSLAAFAPASGRPALEAVSTACLGGLRGIIADLLWMRALREEEEGRLYEIIALLDGILHMQPHFTSVWVYQARVLAFDFGSSIETQDPEEAYRWIRRGMEVLEEGARRNPTSYMMHFALADIYLRKLSERSVDRKTWEVILGLLHRDLVRSAKAEGRPPPVLDRYLGINSARRHFLLAARKPDISPSRKLLCERLAIRCLERMGQWREAELEWLSFLERVARRERRGRESLAYQRNRFLFRQFMRHQVALLLEMDRGRESREVHARMQGYFDDTPGYRELIAEEVRGRWLMRNPQGSRELYRLLHDRLGESRSHEEIVGKPGD